jgi:hypothetical protein
MPHIARRALGLSLAFLTIGGCHCGAQLTSADGLAVSPAELDFGDVTVATQATKPLTLSNDGVASLQVQSAVITGDGDFQIQAFSASTLGPGDSQQLQISFTPSTVGFHSATLAIATDSSASPSVFVQLSGVGVIGPVPDGGPDAGSDAGPVIPAAGCADGTREGFTDEAQYPRIAACSGAWSVPGVDGANAAGPKCGRGAGNDTSNTEGAGCASVDLCATGWHICEGFEEVAANAPTGCGAALPQGSYPNDWFFFAIAQPSCNNTVCDDGGLSCGVSGDVNTNDVFGCGDLGQGLPTANGCGPLTVVLAGTQSGKLNWNQAVPPLGPFQVAGSNSYNEGDFITKDGCPPGSCSEGGTSVANSSDRGGVLCCAD